MPVIGTFDRRIEIQAQSVTRDNFGDKIIGWNKLALVWARVTQTGVSEDFSNENEREIALRNARFRIRYRADVDETMRIVYDGLPWDIEGIGEWGRRAELELHCQTDVHRPMVSFTPLDPSLIGRITWGADTLITWGGDEVINWNAI